MNFAMLFLAGGGIPQRPYMGTSEVGRGAWKNNVLSLFFRSAMKTIYRSGKVVKLLLKIQANSGPSKKKTYSYYQGHSILVVFSRDVKGKTGQRRWTIVRIHILTIPIFFTFNGKIRIFLFLLLFPIGTTQYGGTNGFQSPPQE